MRLLVAPLLSAAAVAGGADLPSRAPAAHPAPRATGTPAPGRAAGPAAARVEPGDAPGPCRARAGASVPPGPASSPALPPCDAADRLGVDRLEGGQAVLVSRAGARPAVRVVSVAHLPAGVREGDVLVGGRVRADCRAALAGQVAAARAAATGRDAVETAVGREVEGVADGARQAPASPVGAGHGRPVREEPAVTGTLTAGGEP